MKMKRFSIWRSGLSLVLAICLIVGVCPVTALAADTGLRYVAMGDSMTNGYGLNGYDADGEVKGYLQEVPEAYPVQFAAWLEEKTGKAVELTQLAISGMRAEDAAYLLTYGSENAFPADDCTQKWLFDFAENVDLDNIYPGARGLGNMAKKYQESVRNADIITLNLGNNNFGTFLTNRLAYEVSKIGFDLGGNYYETDLELMLGTVDSSLAGEAQVLYDALMEIMMAELTAQGVDDEFVQTFARSITDAAVYSYVGFVAGYKSIVEYIAANNPDAEIMLVSLPNHLKDMEFALPGENGETVVVDLGQYFGYLIESANLYLTALPTLWGKTESGSTNTVYYADPNAADLLVHEIAKGNFDEYSVLHRAMVEDVCSMVFDIADPDGDMFARDITLEQVQALETALAGEDLMSSAGPLLTAGFTQKRLAGCAAYLGFEKAIIRAAGTATIDSGAFAALLDEGTLSQLFADALARYEQGIVDAVAADPTIQNMKKLGLDTTQLEMLVQLKATPDVLSEALDDPSINALLHLMARFLIGDGAGCHPSNAGYDTVTEALIAAYTTGYTADEEFAIAMEKLMKLLEEHGPAAEGMLNAATTAKYVLREDSYYVALGDGSAAAASYAEKLAAQLGIPCRNLAEELDTVEDQLAMITSDKTAAAHIKRADLITVGFSNVTFINQAINSVLSGGGEVNWTKYVSEEDAVKIKQAIADIVVEMTGTSNDTIKNALEIFAFSCVSYACALPELVNAVRKINPDAVVIIVGMYNPLAGVVFEMNDIQLDVGEYLDYLVDAAAIHATAYCATTNNAIYVDAPEVDTINDKSVLGLVDMVGMIRNDCDILNPSDAGHTYIKNQILGALTVTEPGSVDRVYGRNRFKTSLGIAGEMKKALGADKFQSVILADGGKFADALTGSYLASVENAPILLVNESSLAEVKSYVQDNLASEGKIYILGGTTSVPESIETAMAEVGTVIRLQGRNRYETNLRILETTGISGKDLLVCSGADKAYADSLSASSAGRPILLVGEKLTDTQTAYLENADVSQIIILGGESSVSVKMAEALKAYDGDGIVERIGGKNRYLTSQLVSERFFGTSVGNAVLAYGDDFPDGLCGGPLAAVLRAPVVLAKEGNSDSADAYIQDAAYGIVLGGTKMISDETVAEIFELETTEDITHKYAE